MEKFCFVDFSNQNILDKKLISLKARPRLDIKCIKYIYESDEPFSIVFDVNTKKKEDDFVFGIGVFNSEGIQCYGTNTFIEDFKSLSISGKGKVKVHVPALNLINGTYFLNVAVHKRDGYPFDYHHFQYTFKVTSSEKDVGIARIPHNWEFSKNIKLEKTKYQKGKEDKKVPAAAK